MKNKKNYVYGSFACKTDIGKVRLSNEDRAGAYTNAKGNILLIVCDGMGGQNKGDLASSLAINTIVASFKDRKGFLNTGSNKQSAGLPSLTEPMIAMVLSFICLRINAMLRSCSPVTFSFSMMS